MRKKEDPLDASNRRISLIVQYLNKPAAPEDDAAKGTEKAGGQSGEKKTEGPGAEKQPPAGSAKPAPATEQKEKH